MRSDGQSEKVMKQGEVKKCDEYQRHAGGQGEKVIKKGKKILPKPILSKKRTPGRKSKAR